MKYLFFSSSSLTAKTLFLLVASGVLALLGNAFSPVSIPWHYDWSFDSWNRATASGYHPIGYEEASAFQMAGKGLILDARSPEEYEAGHIPGAGVVPWQVAHAFLEEEGSRLDPQAPILIYCSSVYCDASLFLADVFKEWGFTNLKIYVAGFEDWKSKGGKVKTEEQANE